MAKYSKTSHELHLDVIFQSSLFSRRNQQCAMTSESDSKNFKKGEGNIISYLEKSDIVIPSNLTGPKNYQKQAFKSTCRFILFSNF